MSVATNALVSGVPPPYGMIETSDPLSATDTGSVYTKDVTGRTELFYEDDTGAKVQLTSAGAISGGALPPPWVTESTTSASIRNSTSACTFSVYNTYTAGTPDYERLEFLFSSNVAIIRTAKNGTGTLRTLDVRYAGTTTSAILIPNSTTSSIEIGLSNAIGASAFTAGRVTIGRASTTTATGAFTNYELAIASAGGPAPTSTSALFWCGIAVLPTVNYSAGTPGAGKVYLAHFAPTLTAQPTGNNAGIAFSSAFAGTTFPAIRFFNTADEDTNTEQFKQGWGIVNANEYGMQTVKTGSGVVRSFVIYTTSSLSAITIPTANSNAMYFSTFSLGTSAVYRTVVANTNACAATAGTGGDLQLNGYVTVASTSTLNWNALAIETAINYSNGTPGAGYVNLIRLAPVNTALPTGVSAAICLSSTTNAINGIVQNNQADEQTNYEHVKHYWTGNVYTIGSYKGGSGTLRGLTFGIAGNSISFYGATPQARPGAYTLNATVVTSRTLLASASATAVNCNNVIAQMIQDLQAVGLFQ